ncbi:sulfate adenylyltransferase subunit CysN [Oleispirillum naphthae]|uniref:sulfate adenylyltransferase subunit CysN n=1 Tax=Oleispirillum naphthae TaxID=2838853 RepID=UPI003082513A
MAEKDLLRFLTCGSVDDGKSTLIGRLLWDAKLIFDDQMRTLEAESRRLGTQGDGIDFALLLDGLQAEREQGITIDVAYRFFATETRKFIVADTPGHEQYTRNMATGASTADAAVILVDARKGLLPQTRRHSFIVSLMGIRHVVLAVNKMDAVDYGEAVFAAIRDDYLAFAAPLGFAGLDCLPISALKGDMVYSRGDAMPWYGGPTLMDCLEAIEAGSDAAALPFRMPVQWVCRPDANFRGYCGSIESGTLRVGDRVAVPSSGQVSTVRRIATFNGDLQEAAAGDAVNLVLADEIDVSRGEMLAAADARPDLCDQFMAKIIWMHGDPLLPGRKCLMKIGADLVAAQVSEIKHKINVNTFEETAARSLALNEIGMCNVAADRAVAFDPYGRNRGTGRFILIDRYSNATVGAGLIEHALRRATNVHRQKETVDKAARAAIKGQKPCVLWFTGLSGSGKSTLADLVERELHARGRHTVILDGDNLRHGLNRNLGFTDADRVENIRRTAEVAKLCVEAGLIVLVSLISPFRTERRMARELLGEGEFLEIFVDTPLALCEARDVKGLYAKARKGEIPNFTGVQAPYEPPEAPELRIDGDATTPEEGAARILEMLQTRGR